jgi:hypothetical protein
VTTADGQVATMRIPALESAPTLPPAPAPTPTPAPASTLAPALAPAPSSPDHTASLLVLGGTALLAGASILALVEHQSQVNAYNSDSSCPPISAVSRPAHCSDYVNAANTWNTVAIVGFVTTGLALTAGITLWITAPRPAAAPAPTTSLHLLRCTGGLASVACEGTF